MRERGGRKGREGREVCMYMYVCACIWLTVKVGVERHGRWREMRFGEARKIGRAEAVGNCPVEKVGGRVGFRFSGRRGLSGGRRWVGVHGERMDAKLCGGESCAGLGGLCASSLSRAGGGDGIVELAMAMLTHIILIHDYGKYEFTKHGACSGPSTPNQ